MESEETPIETEPEVIDIDPVIVVHGGAWAVTENIWVSCIAGVKEAALKGYAVLRNGGSAIDAVEAAVVVMENNPTFNAGTGSALTYDSKVEQDAIIMDGTNMNAGAVGAIRNCANPIKIARIVMEKTPHVLIVGEGANKLAKLHGIDEVDVETLITPLAKARLEEYKKFNATIHSLFNKTDTPGPDLPECDTVGCVALSAKGHLASATSTGGITGKLPGRVGDSPIIGAGGYADDDVAAVSTTGHGEAILKACLANRVVSAIDLGVSPDEAIASALQHMESRIHGFGGAICISREGEVGLGFSTPRMSWAYVQGGRLHYGIHQGLREVDDIPN